MTPTIQSVPQSNSLAVNIMDYAMLKVYILLLILIISFGILSAESYDLLITTFSPSVERSDQHRNIIKHEILQFSQRFADQFNIFHVFTICHSKEANFTQSYPDILFLPCNDSYGLLYTKTYKFWTEIANIIDAKYYLKIDIDTVVCWGLFFPFIINLSNRKCDMFECNLYIGHILTLGKVRNDPEHKWYDGRMAAMYQEIYKKIPHYWPFAEGGFYILSKGLVKVINLLKDSLALIKNEDAMVGSWVLGLNKEIIHLNRNGPIFFHPVKAAEERIKIKSRSYLPSKHSSRFATLNSSVCFFA